MYTFDIQLLPPFELSHIYPVREAAATLHPLAEQATEVNPLVVVESVVTRGDDHVTPRLELLYTTPGLVFSPLAPYMIRPSEEHATLAQYTFGAPAFDIHVVPPFELVHIAFGIIDAATKFDPDESDANPYQYVGIPVDVLHVHVDPPF